MTKGLIGYTGFVGGTLREQAHFELQYNSKNIDSIKGKDFELVVCAGAPASKWLINQNPEADRENMHRLMDNLSQIRAQKFVLISTVDVFEVVNGVTEETSVPESSQAYGRHRLQLENFARGQFPNAVVVRLPGLFGKGLKKNIIFDLLHDNALDFTDHRSVHQYYDLSALWEDLQVILKSGVPLVHMATEPVAVSEIAEQCFGRQFTNVTKSGPVFYDLRSVHAGLFGSNSPYMYSRLETIKRIAKFVESEKQPA